MPSASSGDIATMLRTDRVAGVALVAIGLYCLWESRILPLGTLRNPGPAYVPIVLALLVILFGVLTAATGGASPRVPAVRWREWRHPIIILMVCAFVALTLERLGWRATVALSLAFLVAGVERKGLLIGVGFGLALAFGSYYVFDTLLRVRLPLGPLGM
jgi:Tripartite tricarboxylate transporter TctB family